MNVIPRWLALLPHSYHDWRSKGRMGIIKFQRQAKWYMFLDVGKRKRTLEIQLNIK